MESLAERFYNRLKRLGRTVEINGYITEKALFHEMPGSLLSTYFDSSEQAALYRPAMMGWFAADSDIAPGQWIELNGRVYSVIKTAPQNMGDEMVCTVALLS